MKRVAIGLGIIAAVAASSAMQGKPATKIAVGTSTNFTLDKFESKDLAITLGKGQHYIQADLKLVEGRQTNIQMQIDLLKTNGTMVQSRIVYANDIHAVTRVGATFNVAAAGAYRLRVKNDSVPMEYWVRVWPLAKRTFVAFPSGNGELKPLAIGSEAGKGGTFGKQNGEEPWWAYHKITLQPGKYDISLYMQQVEEGKRTNLMGSIELLDAFGVSPGNWKLNMNEIDYEARVAKQLVVIKPTTYIFKVTNGNYGDAANYTVGIEKI
jgi:hypothetical protein